MNDSTHPSYKHGTVPNLEEGTDNLLALTADELVAVQKEMGKVLRIANEDVGQTRVQQSMRHMAWERAKGELMSMLWTWEAMTDDYEWFEAEIHDFIEKVEERI